jgi:predicted enzyme related to lactoylglutathione lyase
MAGSVTHFEIYAEEPHKLADFYRNLFGWTVEKAPGIDYWRIRTEPATGNGFNAGLARRPLSRLRSWLNYVNVDSLDGAVEQARRLGGEVLTPKTAVPRTGWYAVIADPEGNTFAIWQTDPNAFPAPQPD